MEEIIIDNKKCEDLARLAETLLLCGYASHNTVEINNLIREEAYKIEQILKQSKRKEKRNVNYDCEMMPVINSQSCMESYKLIVKQQ